MTELDQQVSICTTKPKELLTIDVDDDCIVFIYDSVRIGIVFDENEVGWFLLDKTTEPIKRLRGTDFKELVKEWNRSVSE